jgi:hypothetical protein
MSRPSVMEHKFSSVPEANIPRSSFDRKHAYKTTINADYLYPFYLDHVMPGDTLKFNASLMARMSTPLNAPIMDNLFLDTFYFYVPYRIVWDNFRKFMGERVDPSDSISYTVPQISSATGGFVTGTLADYFGLPVDSTVFSGNTLSVMSLPFRGYNLIWNEFFRDEGIQDSATVDTDDGADSLSDYVLLKRCKRHDYFTSARPWPQRGDAVSLSMTGEAPVLGIGKYDQTFSTNNQAVYESDATTSTYVKSKLISTDSSSYFYVEEDPDNTGYPYVRADLSSVSASTINEIREAIATQQLLEKDARYGTRYHEIIESHFGVTNPMPAYRPEFLGGNSTRIIVNPVAQTSESSTTDQGTLTAFAQAVSTDEGWIKSFTEHGMVIGLVNIRGDITYQNGVNRFWFKDTRYDFYWPSFAHLGEQEVLKGEIFAQGTSTDSETWGYQERWSEYKYTPSLITGQLRSSHATSLDSYHVSEDFATLPNLSSGFIESNTPMSRISAVTSEDYFIFDSFINCKAIRPMPVYCDPGLARL